MRKKQVLGIYQANTESGASCLGLLNDLEKGGSRQAASSLLLMVARGSIYSYPPKPGIKVPDKIW